MKMQPPTKLVDLMDILDPIGPELLKIQQFAMEPTLRAALLQATGALLALRIKYDEIVFSGRPTRETPNE